MRSIIYAHLPQTLSLQPFIGFLYENDEDLASFSEELVEIFHEFLESRLEIQSYIEDRAKDIENTAPILEQGEVLSSLKELVLSVSRLVERFSDPEKRVVDIRLQLPNIIRLEVVTCHALLLDLNTTVIG